MSSKRWGEVYVSFNGISRWMVRHCPAMRVSEATDKRRSLVGVLIMTILRASGDAM